MKTNLLGCDKMTKKIEKLWSVNSISNSRYQINFLPAKVTGVIVLITIFNNFQQKMAFFLKTNVIQIFYA
jgi:hypothetical protein